MGGAKVSRDAYVAVAGVDLEHPSILPRVRTHGHHPATGAEWAWCPCCRGVGEHVLMFLRPRRLLIRDRLLARAWCRVLPIGERTRPEDAGRRNCR